MTDTPMTPDQPAPVELTEQQLDALSAAGNRALNDHYHESQCHCDAWPTNCVSSGNYFMGAWDTSAFDIGLPAVLAAWETLRNDRGAAKVAELLAEVDRLRKALSEATGQIAELEDDLGKASAEAAALRQRLHEAAMARVWTNEDGKKFVFADDIKGPLLGRKDSLADEGAPEPDMPVLAGKDWDGPLARCSWGRHLAALLPNGHIGTHRMGEGWLNRCPGVGKPPRADEPTP